MLGVMPESLVIKRLGIGKRSSCVFIIQIEHAITLVDSGSGSLWV